MIYEYVRDRNGHPLGVVCALGKKDIGWSLCNRRMGDKFNKELGLKIAQGRAITSYVKDKKVPQTITPILEKMKERAKRYFK